MQTITSTPWGRPQDVEWITDRSTGKTTGIAFVSTAGHGGYYVSPELLATMPANWLGATFNEQGRRGWFEEDCDWSLVALAFPQCFIPEELRIARASSKHWHEPKLFRGAFEGY
jgi:hypothetical protein